jgi:hypothetical protein
MNNKNRNQKSCLSARSNRKIIKEYGYFENYFIVLFMLLRNYKRRNKGNFTLKSD